jgi:hypothetical protein
LVPLTAMTGFARKWLANSSSPQTGMPASRGALSQGDSGGTSFWRHQLELETGLTERWARQHSLRMEREVAGDLPRASGDPALFLCLTHRLLLGCAANLRPGGGIVLRAESGGGGIRIGLHP